MTKQETIVRTIAQVIGGVAVFRLIQVLWGIEIAETHVGRSHSAIYNVCTADLAGEGVLSMIPKAGKSTYLTTVRLDPSWDILNLRANFQRNQKFSYFLRAVTSLFHDIRTVQPHWVQGKL